jgi:hypothetical protein
MGLWQARQAPGVVSEVVSYKSIVGRLELLAKQYHQFSYHRHACNVSAILLRVGRGPHGAYHMCICYVLELPLHDDRGMLCHIIPLVVWVQRTCTQCECLAYLAALHVYLRRHVKNVIGTVQMACASALGCMQSCAHSAMFYAIRLCLIWACKRMRTLCAVTITSRRLGCPGNCWLQGSWQHAALHRAAVSFVGLLCMATLCAVHKAPAPINAC